MNARNYSHEVRNVQQVAAEFISPTMNKFDIHQKRYGTFVLIYTLTK